MESSQFQEWKTIFILASFFTSTRSSGNTIEAVVPAEPGFVSGVKNVTVPEGRDVTLSCTVRNLGTHKVAWIHYDRSAILTVQNNVITRNPRIGVSHDGHSVWNLVIRDVERADEGQYMCQINTARAKTRLGTLHVVVPPRIVDSLSSSDKVRTEGTNVTLECVATGSPEPKVVWKREDGNKINLSKNVSMDEVEGPILRLTKVSRADMGAFMCIARNGVPPAVSKRIELGIDFPPMLWVPAQLVAAYHGHDASLLCAVEAHPDSLNYWALNGDMLHQGPKYRIREVRGTPAYKVEMHLTIHNVGEADFGQYRCIAKNPRGETDGSITLYEQDHISPMNEIDNRQYHQRKKNKKKSRYYDRTTQSTYSHYEMGRDPGRRYNSGSSSSTHLSSAAFFLAALVSTISCRTEPNLPSSFGLQGVLENLTGLLGVQVHKTFLLVLLVIGSFWKGLGGQGDLGSLKRITENHQCHAQD